MLINFSFENWMSFSEPSSFSMIATRERQHGERLSRINKYKLRVLPIAAIYGGNASGKSNFFYALKFVKKMVVNGTGAKPEKMIDVEPFKLNSEAIEKPSRFKVEVLANGSIFELSFAVTKKKVIEERLVQVLSSRERVLYDRQEDSSYFDSSLKKDEALMFAFKGTRDNQLFLTNSISQKIDTFRPVYNWFKNNLVLIAPDTRFGDYGYFIDEEDPKYRIMNDMLPLLDTGIAKLGGEEMLLEDTSIPEELKEEVKENIQELKENESILIMSPRQHKWYTVTLSHGKIIARKLVTYHENTDGEKTKFEIVNESDGTRRVIDLLPAILDISAKDSEKVYVVDEVDRSLHTLLSRKLLETFLSKCSENNRSQLMFSTHDVLLMDQELLRRDEMWVTERNLDGSTRLFSFSDFEDVRYDKDIRKSYLQGRLGGIPKIFLTGLLPRC